MERRSRQEDRLATQSAETPILNELVAVLDRMIGHHRDLLEACREERTALSEANLRTISEKTHAKEFLIESIRGLDRRRVELVGELAYTVDRDVEPTLSAVILACEHEHSEISAKLRSQQTTLVHLVGSIQKANEQNRLFLEVSVTHIEEMKKNVLGEGSPKKETYGNKATVQPNKKSGARLLSKEV